jgi:hypothetical protein
MGKGRDRRRKERKARVVHTREAELAEEARLAELAKRPRIDHPDYVSTPDPSLKQRVIMVQQVDDS